MKSLREQLKENLDTLCVLRELLDDAVMKALRAYLGEPTGANYSAFASALYNANGGKLSAHIWDICANSANVYVRTVGEGREVPKYMEDSLVHELTLMQKLADLKTGDLQSMTDYEEFLPGFETTETDIVNNYRHRIENIGKYGYGIYARNRMFYVDEDGAIVPVAHPDKTTLSDLVDYERERNIIIENTKALLCGKPAANILLTGDAGTGKSSTIKAVENALFTEGLRIIEVRKDQLRAIPKLLNELSTNPLKFVLFIDDLSFLKDDDNFNALKAVLEGSVSAKSGNVAIYATSNRRHIIKESFSDRDGDDVHRNDTMQEIVSLSERFGIHVSFSKPNKETYLKIVRHLAEEAGLQVPVEELEAGAERMALERGGRSARRARQYIDGLLSK